MIRKFIKESNKRLATDDPGKVLGLALGEVADLEVSVVHAVVVIEVGQGLNEGTAGDSVAANGVKGSLDGSGERLFEGLLEQCHLGFQIGGFFGIEG